MHCHQISAIAFFILACSAQLPAQSGNTGKFNKYEDVSGFINITEVGGGLGFSSPDNDFSKYFAGITTVHGYVIDHHFLTGIGIGVHAYDTGLIIPLYLDIRYTFNNRKYMPFIYGDGGLLIAPDNPEDFGLFVNPGMGVMRNLSKSIRLSLSAGIFVQQLEERASFIHVKLGIHFLSNSGDPCRSKR